MFLKVQSRITPLPESIASRLPSGRHSLTRELVLASQRGRLLDAMAQAVAVHGYASTTVAQVVERAGVSRKTFYEHFADKEECFIALYDTGIAYVLGRILDALDGYDDPKERVGIGLRAFLQVLSEEPAFCRAMVAEAQAAGAVAVARRRVVLRIFAERYLELNRLAREADPRVAPLSDDVALGLVGAILELVSLRVEEGRTDALPELAEELSAFVARNAVAPA
jgi:AcrR family transcriptional regulator